MRFDRYIICHDALSAQKDLDPNVDFGRPARDWRID